MAPKKDIFDQYRDQKDQWDQAPPPSAWERLESRLDAEAPPHPGRPWKPFVWGGSVVALLIVLSIALWRLAGPKEPAVLSSPVTAVEEPRQRTETPVVPEEAEEPTVPNQDRLLLNRVADSLDTSPVELLTDGEMPRRPELEVNWDSLIPSANFVAFDYDSANLNPGNMIVTNRYGNVRDTVQDLGQYRQLRSLSNDNVYLQLNTRRNDLDYRPRSGSRAPDPVVLEHFKWLLGSWKRNGPGGATIETWKQLDEFTLEGRGYFLVNGDTLLAEKMRIEQRGHDVYYIVALDAEGRPVKFRLRSVEPGEAIFETGRARSQKEITIRQDDANNYSTILNDNRSYGAEERSFQRADNLP